MAEEQEIPRRARTPGPTPETNATPMAKAAANVLSRLPRPMIVAPATTPEGGVQ